MKSGLVSVGVVALLALAWAVVAQDGTGIPATAPEHELLKSFAGEWAVAGKYRVAPDQPWQEMKIAAKNELVLGGRFVQIRYVGDAVMGLPGPFEGLGFLGFDVRKRKYVSAWMDNMETTILTGEGPGDAAARTITITIGPPNRMTNVYKIESADKFVVTAYSPSADGKDVPMMEMVHTRKK